MACGIAAARRLRWQPWHAARGLGRPLAGRVGAAAAHHAGRGLGLSGALHARWHTEVGGGPRHPRARQTAAAHADGGPPPGAGGSAAVEHRRAVAAPEAVDAQPQRLQRRQRGLHAEGLRHAEEPLLADRHAGHLGLALEREPPSSPKGHVPQDASAGGRRGALAVHAPGGHAQGGDPREHGRDGARPLAGCRGAAAGRGRWHDRCHGGALVAAVHEGVRALPLGLQPAVAAAASSRGCARRRRRGRRGCRRRWRARLRRRVQRDAEGPAPDDALGRHAAAVAGVGQALRRRRSGTRRAPDAGALRERRRGSRRDATAVGQRAFLGFADQRDAAAAGAIVRGVGRAPGVHPRGDAGAVVARRWSRIAHAEPRVGTSPEEDCRRCRD
mmetsp:Transcript_9792/g.28431  ORF Transcript_9792/g.28431 Transcript_9792/m.28431 type:complete len:386 (-) Transcript_9792:307-1464(-)